MTFDHIMADTETLGVRPGCSIMAIAAVSFNPYTAERGPVFYRNIDRASCRTMGLTEEPKTYAWWQEPERAEAWAVMQDGQVAIWHALADFSAYWEQMRARRLWCQGLDFDLPVLTAAYDACALKIPWDYNAGRDTRTIYEAADLQPDKSAGMLHHALHDAQRQADAVEAAFRKLGLGPIASKVVAG